MNPLSYLKILRESISNLNFYLTLKRVAFKKIINFYAISFIILGLILALIFNLQTIPQLEQDFNSDLELVKNNYPEDLVINWDGEALKINREELILDYPQIIKHQTGLPKYFLTYFSGNFSAENSSLFALDQKNLYFSNAKGEWRQFPLQEILTQNFEIKQNNLGSKLEEFQNLFSKQISKLKIYSLIFMPIGLLIYRFLIVLIDSLIVLLFARIFLKIDYQNILKISLHLAVIAQLISILGQIIYAQINFNLFALSFWLMTIIILVRLKKAPN